MSYGKIMRIFITSFSIQKEGNMPHENEDKIYPRTHYAEGKKLAFAIADGATEGYCSKKWARILVRVFVRNPLLQMPLSIEKALQSWNKWFNYYLKKREILERPIRWFEEMAIEKGAFSTLLGLTLCDVDNKTGFWTAHAVGDSCMFHVRNDELLTSFPIDKSILMNNRPVLVASNPKYNREIYDNQYTLKGNYQSEDHIYLATDALAQWFLIEYESGNKPWKILNRFTLEKEKSFSEWIFNLRNKKLIRNDDITFLHLYLNKTV